MNFLSLSFACVAILCNQMCYGVSWNRLQMTKLIKHIPSTICLTTALLCLDISPSFAASLEQGERVFKESCSACHAGGGNIIPFAKTLSKSSLESNGYDQKEKIIEIVNKGSKNGMLAYGPFTSSKGDTIPGRLTPEQMSDVADYVLQKANQNWE